MALKLVEQDVTIGVMSIPYRVNKALYIMRGNNVTPVAYFKNNRQAREFEKILDSIADPIIALLVKD